jgi:SAM-dependent methyltransferase
MNMTRLRSLVFVTMAIVLAAAAAPFAGAEQQPDKPFEPQVGQAGKDVVWVPTPPELVETMLDLAKVTPQDFVMDLGSGDGRNIIAAAKRGAPGVGVEYNPNMVELSRRYAREAGVADKATFVEGDMYVADISKASVMALFLLPVNMRQLLPKFLDLTPGSRIVSNTFGIEGWTPDESVVVPNCSDWCTALLWIVPAKVEGYWRLPQGNLTLKQDYQVLSGTLGNMPISDGKLRGNEITFSVGQARYAGRVNGNTMEGTVDGTPWTASRLP